MTIYHESVGSGADLVLLHGWGFNHTIWRPLMAACRQSFRFHLIDLPGFGFSSSVPLSDDLSQNVMKLLPHLPKQAIYLGWSLGGLMAQQLAIDFPEKVSGLLLLASTPCFVAKDNWQGVSVDYANDFYRAVAADHTKALKQFLLFSLVQREQQKRYVNELWQHFFTTTMPQQHSLLTGLQLLNNTDLRRAINAIDCPMMFCHGDLDPLTFRNDKLNSKIITGAGHFPMYTHIDCLLERLFELFVACRSSRDIQ